MKLPSLNSSITLNYNNEFFNFYVPDKDEARHLEAEWSSALVFSNLDSDIFIMIYLAILLEHSIVFVSNNA